MKNIFQDVLAGEEIGINRPDDWRALFDLIPDPIAVIDRQYHIVVANRSMATKLGLSPEECVGKTCYHHVHGTTAPPKHCPHAQFLLDGKCHVRAIEENTLGGHYQVSVSPFYDAEGRLLGSVHVAHDINTLRETIDDLRRSKERQQLILDTAAEGIYGIDRNGRTMFVNPAAEQMLGYSAREIIGRPSHALIHHSRADGRSLPLSDSQMMAAMHEGRVIKVEEELLWRKDGSSFPAEYTSAPIVHNGIAEGVVVVFNDISGRKQCEAENRAMAERVRQMQKYECLNVLASGIAHNFNNILTAVIGNLDLLRMTMPPDLGEQQIFIEEALKSSKRAAELSGMMLNYVGQGQISFEVIDLSMLLSNLQDTIGNILPAPISIHNKSYLDKKALIKGDSSLIHQAIIALLSNACEACEGSKTCDIKESKVHLTVGQKFFSTRALKGCPTILEPRAGEYVFLEVRDQGIGMSKEVLNRIFDPFFSTKFTGRGLGMAQVLGIVKRHDGGILLASAPGVGTTITLLFPVLEMSADKTEQKQERAESALPDGLVLLVDDEEMLLQLGCHILNRAGIRVVTASNGVEAMRVFAKHQKDIALVILDLTMPKMDGIETFKRLREKRPQLPVIIATAQSKADFVSKLQDASYSYLPKPYTGKELLAMVSTAVQDDEKYNSSHL